jgi:hypothetical protein
VKNVEKCFIAELADDVLQAIHAASPREAEGIGYWVISNVFTVVALFEVCLSVWLP